MNSQIRIFVHYQLVRKIILFDPDEPLEAIILLCLEKHGLAHLSKNLFHLMLETNDCFIESSEEIRDGDHFTLQKKDDANVSSDRYESFPNSNNLNREELSNFDDNSKLSSLMESTISEDSYISDQIFEEGIDNSIDFHEDCEETLEEENIEEEASNEDSKIIPLDDIQEKEYASRECLKEETNKWASQYCFRLSFVTRERELIKQDCKVSSLKCNEAGCSFFLEFKTKENGMYQLSNSNHKHTHKLEMKLTARNIDEKILARIKTLKDSVNDKKKLTKHINEEFKTNFKSDSIRYILRKLKNEELGNLRMLMNYFNY